MTHYNQSKTQLLVNPITWSCITAYITQVSYANYDTWSFSLKYLSNRGLFGINTFRSLKIQFLVF